MQKICKIAFTLVLLIFSTTLVASADPAALVGTWQADADNGSLSVPFRFEIAQTRSGLEGRFFNGEDRIVSNAATIDGHHLKLRYDAYARVLDLDLQPDGSLSGAYAAARSGAKTPPAWHVTAHRTQTTFRSAANVPAIDGLWLIPVEGRKKNEHAWRFIAHQDGASLRASVLGVGGDSGALDGTYTNGKWTLSNFSGTRASLYEVTPAADGSLEIVVHDARGKNTTYAAWRPDTARAKGLPEAPDLGAHTSVRDPNEVFAWSFKDLDGKLVSSTDARFKNKVVLVDISGSWCPNCHDEAPFLDELYRKYHAQGLDIVTLDFEDKDEYEDPARLRAFIAKYKPTFSVLLAGTTDQAQEKLPQAVDLDAWPTTFFIARNGLVKHVHSGFSAPATGDFHAAIRNEFEGQIEVLLKDKTSKASLGQTSTRQSSDQVLLNLASH